VPIEALHSLVQECDLEVNQASSLMTVPSDELSRMYNASYVDDNAVAAFADAIEQAIHHSVIHHSVMSAFEVFGSDFRRGHPLQQANFARFPN
jgi:copper(I)-binding protein